MGNKFENGRRTVRWVVEKERNDMVTMNMIWKRPDWARGAGMRSSQGPVTMGKEMEDKRIDELPRILRVGILDDNAFFNRIVTGRLEAYAKFLSKLHKVEIVLHSFTSARQFLEEIRNDYDLVFVDYVLGDNTNGFRVARSLKGYCEKCRIVVFSEFLGPADYMEDTDVYDEWWPKDSKVLDRCCIALDTVLMELLRS